MRQSQYNNNNNNSRMSNSQRGNNKKTSGYSTSTNSGNNRMKSVTRSPNRQNNNSRMMNNSQMKSQMKPQMMQQNQMPMNQGMMMPGGPNSVNRQIMNMDPRLGGSQYRKARTLPSLPFESAVKMTPDHMRGRYVIPWDSKDCDYVYAACPNKVFKGRLTVQKLKQMVDAAMDQTNTRNIGTAYDFMLKMGYAILGIGLFLFLLFVCIIWLANVQAVFKAGAWWLVILPPFAFIAFVLLFICLTKKDEDTKTKNRQIALYGVLRQANRRYLRGSDVRLGMGSYSAWLDVTFDPKLVGKGVRKNGNKMQKRNSNMSRVSRQNSNMSKNGGRKSPMNKRGTNTQNRIVNNISNRGNGPNEVKTRGPVNNSQMKRNSNMGNRSKSPNRSQNRSPNRSFNGSRQNNSNMGNMKQSGMNRSGNQTPRSRNGNKRGSNLGNQTPRSQNRNNRSNLGNQTPRRNGQGGTLGQPKKPQVVKSEWVKKPANSNISQGTSNPKSREMTQSPNFTPGNTSNVGLSPSTPKRGMSAKQRRFYERLQNHKKKKASSPVPLRNSRIQINRGMEVHYDSQVPEQEKIFDPTKSLNLMAQDPYA